MHILWVKMGGLWPLTSGGRLRSFNIVNELARHHDVSVLTTHGDGEDPQELALQLEHCRRVESFPFEAVKWRSPGFPLVLARSWLSSLPVDLWKCQVPALRRRVRELLDSGEVDLCVADFLFAVPNLPFDRRVSTVFFAHNVEHLILQRLCRAQKRPWHRLPLEIEWRKERRYEAQVCRKANLTVAVSPDDRRLFERMAPEARIGDMPTGVDVDYFAPGKGAQGSPRKTAELVFTGSMDWYPNEDAIRYFIADILPLVRREVPEIGVAVVGRNPSRRLSEEGMAAQVSVTGSVPDVRPYMDDASVYVVPLRIGGGTRLKIFEALAMGKAVVSTSIGVEGLPLRDGEHFIRADDPQAFAEAVIALQRDPGRQRELGAAGRRLMVERYGWGQVAGEFARYCETAFKSSAHATARTTEAVFRSQ
ncbi:MAG: glycosyltransferase family 4 protein [Gammaproteobacteria bacterium]|nr:glycosyltransferase family 4 protein [Gammaproteobacteria bacterium]